MTGPLAALLTQLEPYRYDKYITYEKGTPDIYMRFKKSLYGTLQAALLFYKDLTGKLKYWGFELNPYELFFANKNIGGS